MNHRVLAALAGASIFALASTAAAHAQPAAGATAAPEEATLGEIVVTARRKSESLQEVPQTVNAVTADTLQKLNIKQFADVQAVVPGLSLSTAQNGYGSAASLRGVTFDVTTGAEPTVALYLNDAPVQATFLFQSLFDVGQVEVLKGPQGTTRGISAPSGAITVTTHKPDLSNVGGYADVTLTDLQGRNVQGAINVPIIKDVLALRVAAVMDQNRYNGVSSLHSSIEPSQKTSAERATLSFEPSDIFNATVAYEHLDHDYHVFQQVVGSGPGAFTSGTESFPAGFNPPLTAEQRSAVQDQPSFVAQHLDVVTGQADSRIFGQHLSYVGSYQHLKFESTSAQDPANILPGDEIFYNQTTDEVDTTHEFRVASDPAPGRFFDYTVGGFYHWRNVSGTVHQLSTLLPGAFGTTGSINLGAFNQAYGVPILIDVPNTLQETSLFGSVTFHLGPNTELSGGIRHMWSITQSSTIISLQNGLINLGGQDIPLNLAKVIASPSSRSSETPNIYNVSLSHHFTRDFLVYANTGTSFRPPVASVGIQGALAVSTDPLLRSLTFHPSERSRAYEVGFKSQWFDGRARLNASIFRQRFSDLTIFIPGVNYFNTSNSSVGAFDFTASVDALVQGFDVDTAFQVTPEWTISAQASYADGRIQGSQVPCNNAAVLNSSNLIGLCTGGSSSRLPLWNATFQSEYDHPVADNTDGFFRVLATLYPENKNRAEPDFTAPEYSLVNVYLGVRSHDGAWEASVFAKNAFNAQRLLDRSQTTDNLNGALNTAFPSLNHFSGYANVLGMTPEREVGVNVHYAFGSR